VAFINSQSGESTSSNQVASGSFVATAGNLIAVMAGTYNAAAVVSGITDTAGNTYVKAHEKKTQASLELWYAKNIAGHATNVVTVTFTGSQSSARVIVHQYDNRHTTLPLGPVADATVASGTTITSGSFAPAAAGDDVIAGVHTVGGQGTFTAGTNYTLRASAGSPMRSEDRENAPSGAQTAGMTWATSAAADMIVGALAPSGNTTPTLRNAGTPSTGTAATLAPAHPTHLTDDILVVFAASSANASVTPTHSISDGTWALLTSGVITTGTVRSRISAYWKRATSGAETALTVTFTPTGATACHHAAWSNSYQDCATSGTPFEGANNNGAAATNAIAVTRGATAARRLSVIAAHHADNVATGVTEDHADAYTQRVATDSPTGIDGFSYCADFGPVDDDESVTITFTSGGTGVGIAGLAFALLGITVLELEGSPQTVFTLSGAPTAEAGALAISGSPQMTFSLTGEMVVTKFLGDTVVVTWAPSGALEQDVALVGTAVVAFAPSGVPETEAPIAGTTTVAFAPSGALEQDVALTGTAVVAFAPSGTLSIEGGAEEISGSPTVTFGPAAELEVIKFLDGSVAVTWTPTGGLVQDLFILGTPAVAFAPSGSLMQDQFLAGTANVVFTLSGHPQLPAAPSSPRRTRFGWSEPRWKRESGRSAYRRR
jgi:hypothetical protein